MTAPQGEMEPEQRQPVGQFLTECQDAAHAEIMQWHREDRC
jgi:hypothetical protein